MKWNEDSKSRQWFINFYGSERGEFFSSEQIVANAYREGCINWNVYQKALDKIGSNRNGSWMFEQGEARNEQ